MFFKMSAPSPQLKVVHPWLHPAGQTLKLPGLPSICKKTDIADSRPFIFLKYKNNLLELELKG